MGSSAIKGPWQKLRARFFAAPSAPKRRLYIMVKTGHIIYAEVSSNYPFEQMGFVEVAPGEHRLNSVNVNMIVVKD